MLRTATARLSASAASPCSMRTVRPFASSALAGVSPSATPVGSTSGASISMPLADAPRRAWEPRTSAAGTASVHGGASAQRTGAVLPDGVSPSQLPASVADLAWMEGVGETPMLKVGDDGMFVKLEGHNPGNSIKDRALSSILTGLMASGELDAKRGTLVLVTSGSAGISLNSIHKRIRELEGVGFDVLVVFPRAYATKEIPAELLASPDVEVFDSSDALLADAAARGGRTSGAQRALLLDGVFVDVLKETQGLAAEHGWTMLDQHYDECGMMAHKATAAELLAQVPGLTDVVCATGTGATAAGLREYLPEHVQVHARPSASGTIDGLSDVNRYDNFCDTDELAGYTECIFDPDTAAEHQEELEREHGIVAGPSTGATFWLARQVREERPDAKIVFMSADGVARHLDGAAAAAAGVGRTVSAGAGTGAGMDASTLAGSGAAAEARCLTCSGCGESVDGAASPSFSCPNAAAQPGVDHVLVPAPVAGASTAGAEVEADHSADPFLRYRTMLYSHRVALARGMTDAEYVGMARELDAALAEVDGSGFRETPLTWHAELNAFVKDETHNVAQSHKARHLNNVMLYLLALRRTASAGDAAAALATRRLAVASCGNAGLAAAVVASAAGWPIDVCIPPEADARVVERLTALGADVHVCARDGAPVKTALGEVDTTSAADPTLSVFRNLVAHHGSIPFSVQGPECGLAVEGGQTLAWELVTALARDHPSVERLGNVWVQVGGGALGAGLVQGLHRAIVRGDMASLPRGCRLTAMPALQCVQAEGNAPLARAFELMAAAGADASSAAARRSEFMFPWANPASVAGGILDDETYDWVALCEGMTGTGGAARVVSDDAIRTAHELANKSLGVTACTTGAAGLAGMLSHREAMGGFAEGDAPDVVILTGLDRAAAAAAEAN